MIHDIPWLQVISCLFRVKQDLSWTVIHLNPTSLLRIAVMEWQFPAAFALGRGEPQPQQMPARHWRWVVFVRRASVKDILVVHKLNVSDIEYHMQRETLTRILEDPDSFDLLQGKGRDDASI